MYLITFKEYTLRKISESIVKQRNSSVDLIKYKFHLEFSIPSPLLNDSIENRDIKLKFPDPLFDEISRRTDERSYSVRRQIDRIQRNSLQIEQSLMKLPVRNQVTILVLLNLIKNLCNITQIGPIEPCTCSDNVVVAN